MTLLIILILLTAALSILGSAIIVALILYGIAWVLVRLTLLAVGWWQTR